MNYRTQRRRETLGGGDRMPRDYLDYAAAVAVIGKAPSNANQLHRMADAAAGKSVFRRTLSRRRCPWVTRSSTPAFRSSYSG